MINLLEDDVDDRGLLMAPNLRVIDVNLIGCIYTTKLGLHYLKKVAKAVASCSPHQRQVLFNIVYSFLLVADLNLGFQRFSPVEYSE